MDEKPPDVGTMSIGPAAKAAARRAAAGAISGSAAAVLALAAGAALIAAVGANPLHVYARMISETFGSGYGLGQVVFKSTTLIFAGLSVAFAFRAGMFNIGAEGQMYVAGFAAALAGTAVPAGCPGVLAVPACLAAGAAAGTVYGGVPGLLKAKLGVHEVINTIMMNFLAFIFVNHFLSAGLAEPESVHTAAVVESARIGKLDGVFRALEGSAANWMFAAALAAAALCWFFLFRTAPGFRMRAAGLGPRAAAGAGINVPACRFAAMAAAGGIASLAGANFVLGYKHYFEQGFPAGAGYMGIAVALLGRNHPAGVVAAGILFGALSEGGLAINNEVPKEIVEILQAVIIVFLVLGDTLGRRGIERLSRRRAPAKEVSCA